MTKIAFPTDDGETISKHLGQAEYFQVFVLEDGQVQSFERRAKASHTHQDHQHEHEAGVHPGQQYPCYFFLVDARLHDAQPAMARKQAG